MAAYVCEVCGYVYDEDREDVAFESLSDEWTCPVCGSKKEVYKPHAETTIFDGTPKAGATGNDRDKYLREKDEFEHTMADIHYMAATGERIIEPMRTQAPTFSWNEILIKREPSSTDFLSTIPNRSYCKQLSVRMHAHPSL